MKKKLAEITTKVNRKKSSEMPGDIISETISNHFHESTDCREFAGETAFPLSSDLNKTNKKRGFIAFYALTVLFILTFVTFGVEFANVSRGATIQYSFVESQSRQALDAGMAIALRIASSTTEVVAAYSFNFETGPYEYFTVNVETGSGSVLVATVTAVLFDHLGYECARRRGRVRILADGSKANCFAGNWEKF